MKPPITCEMTTPIETRLSEETISANAEMEEALKFIGSQFEAEPSIMGDFNQESMFVDLGHLGNKARNTLEEELCNETPDFIFGNTEKVTTLIDDVSMLFRRSAASLLPSINATVPSASAQSLVAVGWQGTSNFIWEDTSHLDDYVHPLDPLRSLPSSRT
jgi:hypothetical protein